MHLALSKPSLWDPPWLKGMRSPRGGSWGKLTREGTEQDDWPEGRQRPGKQPTYKGFTLPKGTRLSLSWPMCLSACTFPLLKLSTLLFTFCLLAWIHSWLGRQGLGTLPLTAHPCGPVVRTPGPGKLRPCSQLPLTAACCKLPLTATHVQNQNHHNERPVHLNEEYPR